MHLTDCSKLKLVFIIECINLCSSKCNFSLCFCKSLFIFMYFIATILHVSFRWEFHIRLLGSLLEFHEQLPEVGSKTASDRGTEVSRS